MRWYAIKQLSKPLRWISAAAIFLLLFCACQAADSLPRTVPVMLAEAEGLTLTGGSRYMIGTGEDVAFPVSLAEGYVIDSVSGGGQYADGQIVLENVRYPTTLVAHTRQVEDYLFDLTNDKAGGSITSSHTGGLYYEGTEITVEVTPKPGKIFLGFSRDKSLRSGGEIIARDTTYTFTLTDHTELYTNYAGEDSDLIIYHAGGGRFAETTGDMLSLEMADSYYLCPNVNIADDFLTRPGFTLLGYTTDEAGEGKLLTPGANIVMPEERIVHLWPVWAEWTPAEQFTYEDKGSAIAITGYTGSGETLVIPATINGKPVTRIERGAISGSFKTLVLQANLQRIAVGAIHDCPNFTTLFFYDTVKAVADLSFQNCPEFRTLHLCAAQAPRYTNHRHGTYAKKFERLITAEGKKLVVASGSSTVYGLDSETLQKALKNEYAVVNYGTHWGSPVCFYLELISAFVGEGDLVVHAPETRESQLGGNAFEFNIWQMQEGVPEVFAYVDIRNYTNVFTSFSDYNTTRSKLKERTYEDYADCVNDYGDYFTYKKAKGVDYVKSPGAVNFTLSYIKEANTERLNAVAAKIREKGGQLLLSFAPSNRNSLTGDSLRKSTRESYVNRLTSLLDYPCITDVERMLLPGNWFYDSDWHLCTEKSITRAEMLAEDVAAYLKSTSGGTK